MKTSLLGIAAAAFVASASAPGAAAFELPKVGVPDLFGGGSKDAPPSPGATPDCPVVVIEDGGQMIRAPANADAAGVHHQVSIKSTARECIVEGDHLAIRLGVAGDAMLGPAGAPGAYAATLRVILRRTKDDSILSSKTYRINASIPAGAARGDFRILADPIAAPLTTKALDDYEILVGLVSGAAEPVEKTARKKKKGRG